jgi:amino acid adenylation domain-containing protein
VTLIHHFLEHSALTSGDAVALVDGRRRTTYRELNTLADRIATLLRTAGVERHARVILAMDNCLELAAAYFGVLKAGAVAVPLPGGGKSDRLARAIVDCSPSAAIVDGTTAAAAATTQALDSVPVVFVHGRPPAGTAFGEGVQVLQEALAGVDDAPSTVRAIDRDLAAIIYTSGSTGDPKGVMLTHRNLVANARSIVSYLELTSADRVMCVLPFHYVYGLSLLHTHVSVGGSLVIDTRFVFPNVVLAAMSEHAVTGFAGVPSTFALLLHRSNIDAMQFPSLRYVTQAGGGMPPPRVAEWLARGPQVPFYVMYGATEAGARLAYLPPGRLQEKLGSIGVAIPNVEILVVDESGGPVPPGEVGELVARGSNISCGYWNDPVQTGERFSALGYHTGDLGYVDADGYLFLVGRLHDMIKVGANRVGAKEIEDVINEHAAVHEAAVIGTPNDLLGEVPVAFVALRGNLPDAARELKAFCASRLPGYKVPARIEFVAALPKIPGVGKIDKRALRASAETSPSL